MHAAMRSSAVAMSAESFDWLLCPTYGGIVYGISGLNAGNTEAVPGEAFFCPPSDILPDGGAAAVKQSLTASPGKSSMIGGTAILPRRSQHAMQYIPPTVHNVLSPHVTQRSSGASLLVDPAGFEPATVGL